MRAHGEVDEQAVGLVVTELPQPSVDFGCDEPNRTPEAELRSLATPDPSRLVPPVRPHAQLYYIGPRTPKEDRMKTHDAPHPEGHACWFDLMTRDPAQVEDFYRAVFGWTLEDQGEDYGHYRMAYAGGRATAGIGGMPEGAAYPPGWTVHFAVDDVEERTEAARGLGADVMVDSGEVPGMGRFSILQDPTGATFALWEAGGHIGAEIAQAHGAMTWCEVNTPDAAAAKAFYTALLGASAELMEGAGTTYYSLHKGDTAVGGILQMTEEWQGIPPHWMPYFQVDDADAAVAAAKAAGGKVGHGPFDTPFGRIAVINDPAGAVLSVLRPPPTT